MLGDYDSTARLPEYNNNNPVAGGRDSGEAHATHRKDLEPRLENSD